MQKEGMDRRMLESLALDEIRACWGRFNREKFGSSLTPPLFSLSGSSRRLGLYNAATREMSISCDLLFSCSWVEVLEVLKHEMAHQFVFEVLEVETETAHGPTFQRVCQQRGIDARAVGGSNPSVQLVDGVADRVQKLLALARSDNKNESEMAMARAQRLMLEHNITESQAKKSLDSIFVSVSIGGPQVRMPSWRKMLAGMLSRYFFVEAVVVPSFSVPKGKRATEIELIGTEENVEVATYVHDMLLRSASQRWKRYQKTRQIKKRGDKSQFYFGVVSGFASQMKAERIRCDQEGLVWVSDPALQQHMKNKFPRLLSGRRVRTRMGEAYREGHHHGRSVSIKKGIATQRSNAKKLISGRG